MMASYMVIDHRLPRIDYQYSINDNFLVYNFKNLPYRQIIDSYGSDEGEMKLRIAYLKYKNQRHGYAKPLYIVRIKEFKNVKGR